LLSITMFLDIIVTILFLLIHIIQFLLKNPLLYYFYCFLSLNMKYWDFYLQLLVLEK
jgi:hypothetical protein